MKPKALVRNTIIIVLLYSISIILPAQNTPLIKQWDKRFGGNYGLNFIWFGGGLVINSPDGGFLIGTSAPFGSSGDKTQNSQGGNDYWIIKTDGEGRKLWDKRFGGDLDDNLYALTATNDGGYLLGGYSYSGISGDKTQDNRGSSYTADYWVVKIDATGNKLWDRRFGGGDSADFGGDDIMTNIRPTTDGGFLLGGYSNSGISGDKTQHNWGTLNASDYWVVKIDANGNKQWDKRYGGTYSEALYTILPTNNGNFLLGGSSKSDVSGDKTQPSWTNVLTGSNTDDYWVVRIDSNGNKLWDKRFGGRGQFITENSAWNGDESLLSMAATNDGSFILGGYSSSTANGDVSDTNRGASDYWIVKIDGNGNKVWDKRFGGSSYDFFGSMQPTSDGGYFLCGSSCSNIDGDKTFANCSNFSCNYPDSRDFWILEIDADGNKIWNKSYGGDSSDASGFNSSVIAPDGALVVGGWSSSGVSCDKSQPAYKNIPTNRNNNDTWILKLASVELLISLDSDKDGLNDYEELVRSTDSKNFDTNGDVLADGINVFVGLPPLNADTDGDGISNILETIKGTSPILSDTDGDGVSDSLDPFPSDRFRKQLPPVNLSDHTPPVITLQEPVL